MIYRYLRSVCLLILFVGIALLIALIFVDDPDVDNDNRDDHLIASNNKQYPQQQEQQEQQQQQQRHRVGENGMVERFKKFEQEHQQQRKRMENRDNENVYKKLFPVNDAGGEGEGNQRNQLQNIQNADQMNALIFKLLNDKILKEAKQILAQVDSQANPQPRPQQQQQQQLTIPDDAAALRRDSNSVNLWN